MEIGGRKWNVCVLMENVADNQIGFGKDEFFIDQKFVLTVSKNGHFNNDC